ncbi:outer membrane beta-barrel protein [Psychroserpens mesophilus]|uniref:outer membrane beta-barrel protein n=1 Tax=Psychroserpens mesophilus TaxID=325473 RepID=UPI003D65AB79
MKKLMLLAAVAVFSLSNVNAQGELRAGLNGGFPIGDAGDLYTFGFGLDVNYLWEVSESFQAGIATGFQTTAGDEFTETIDLGFFGTQTITADIENFDYIPLAAAGRFMASEAFVLGADLGYAIAAGEGDGGFYYAPMVAYNITEKFQAGLSYRGISVDGGSFSTINLGVNYRIL